MMNDTKLSMKAFWEAVEARLTACSAEDLRAILCGLAQEVSPIGRESFLLKLTPPPPASSAPPVLPQADLLADIADLAQEIAETMQNADAWESEHYEWGSSYDDEDTLGPYEEFIEPLAALFAETQAIFDAGDCELAAAAYRDLFTLLDQQDDYGRGIHLSDLTSVDAGETAAR